MIDMRGVGKFVSFIIVLSETEDSRNLATPSPGQRMMEGLQNREDVTLKRKNTDLTIPFSLVRRIIGIESMGGGKLLIIAQTDEDIATNIFTDGRGMMEDLQNHEEDAK